MVADLDFRLSPESGKLTSANVGLLGVLEQGGRLLAVGGDPQAVCHPHPLPHAAPAAPLHPLRVDLADADAAVDLVAAAPLVDVDGGGDGGAVVGDVGLQRAVQEQVVLLNKFKI